MSVVSRGQKTQKLDLNEVSALKVKSDFRGAFVYCYFIQSLPIPRAKLEIRLIYRYACKFGVLGAELSLFCVDPGALKYWP